MIPQERVNEGYAQYQKSTYYENTSEESAFKSGVRFAEAEMKQTALEFTKIEITPEKFLQSKGVFSLDTKKRTKEVCEWMQEYANLQIKASFPSRDWFMDIIDKVVDENQVLGSANIADGIIEEFAKFEAERQAQ